MPRNGSSVYSLPAGNPVVPGTTISTAWANGTLTDIATALTQSLSTDGSTASVSLAGKNLTAAVLAAPTLNGTTNLAGGQIQFPAVAVASGGANVLDDYEEGTWTPVITFATPGDLNVAYSRQVGKYIKIGSAVSITIDVVTSTFTHTTASGIVLIGGLPFTTQTNMIPCSAVRIDAWAWGAGNTSLVFQGLSSSTQMTIATIGTGASANTLTASGHTTGINTVLTASFTYFAV